MKTIERQVEHCWKPMEEYKISGKDSFDWIEGSVNERIEIIRKMKPNQYISIVSRGNIRIFNRIIENIKDEGLDIGKGNCEYGYRMPLPINGDTNRKLIIFRRQL